MTSSAARPDRERQIEAVAEAVLPIIASTPEKPGHREAIMPWARRIAEAALDRLSPSGTRPDDGLHERGLRDDATSPGVREVAERLHSEQHLGDSVETVQAILLAASRSGADPQPLSDEEIAALIDDVGPTYGKPEYNRWRELRRTGKNKLLSSLSGGAGQRSGADPQPDLKHEYIVIHAPGWPAPFKPTPQTREAAERFQREHGGTIRTRVISEWSSLSGGAGQQEGKR